MKIGIDCRMWNETGIGRYIRNIVNEIAKVDQVNDYVLFVLSKDASNITLGSNFKLHVTDIRWHTFREQLILPIHFYKESLDILFIPNLNVPVLYLKRYIVTLHDLTVIKVKTGRASTHFYPFYLIKRFGVKIALFVAVHRAKAILTVSEYVKKEIMESYNITSNKLTVVPCAAESNFKNTSVEKDILVKYGISQPYLFYVGNAHPHKNLERLLQAFEEVVKVFPNITLVLGGSKNFFYERLENECKGSSVFNKIKFIGFVEDEDLPALYSMSEAFVNPSLYEGFGIQLLEAFACGTKVVSSNSTSLPEVGGNIAYYFNPKDVTNMSLAIITCLKDSTPDRIIAGYERVKEFSWVRSAKIIHEILTNPKI